MSCIPLERCESSVRTLFRNLKELCGMLHPMSHPPEQAKRCIQKDNFCSVLGKSHLGAKRDFEIWAFKVFFSLDTKSTPQNGFQMPRPENQKCKEQTGDSSQGVRYPLVPLLGSKNEVVAPIFRFRTDFLKSVLAKWHLGADFRKNST